MPRRKSSAATTPASTKSHKRQLSNDRPATATPGARASKRLKESTENTPTSATPKKSKYFEEPGSEVEDEEDEPSSVDLEESGYEDEDASATEAEPTEDEEEDDYDSEEDSKKKPRGKKLGGIGSAIVSAGKNLWREGVKAGLGPGKQVFIEKPKPRGDGGIKYVPERIHPNTMLFLADLKKNNDREWLKSMCLLVLYADLLVGTSLTTVQCTILTTGNHGKIGRASLMHSPRRYLKFMRHSINCLRKIWYDLSCTICLIHLTSAPLQVFRIYRDVRFSPDPTPYKVCVFVQWPVHPC